MKKEIIIWIVIALLVGIAALKTFDSFTRGQYQVRWAGVRHIGFGSLEKANMIQGRVEKFTVHMFGPITVFVRHD